jgi:dTMP kinase
MAEKQGKLIVVGGGDGVGKQTQSKLLVEELLKRGEKVIYTEEPTQDGLGAQIKSDLNKSSNHLDARTLQFLFTADRSDHVARVIAPALREGIHVVADRYSESTIAYAMAFKLLRHEVEALLFANQTAFPKPDVVVILDLPLEAAARRVQSRGRTIDRHEKDPQLQLDVKAAYRALAERFRNSNWHLVDASGTIEEVHRQIMGIVDALFS